MSSASAWAAWSIVLPLLGALTSWLLGRRNVTVSLLAAFATLFAVGRLALEVSTAGVLRHRVGGWGAPLGIELRADGAAALLLVVFGGVGALTSAAAVGFFPAGRRRTTFFALWLLGWGGLNALLLSADLFNLYVALELMTLAAVGLVSLGSTPNAFAAALQYLFVALLGSLGYLLAVALVYGQCATLDVELVGRRLLPGTLASAAFLLVAASLSLKSALFPVHAWLPSVYANAPPPVSALLSGVFGKGAFLVFYRAGTHVFPAMLGSPAAQIVGAQGGAVILWASAIACRQQRLKMLLAYSSLAQVGYLFLAFPMGTPLARAGALYMAVSHAAASAAMFTAAGALEHVAGSDSIDALGGVARHHPLTFFSLAIGGLSLMGLPPTGGFIAKWLLVRAALGCGQWWWAFVVLAGGLIAATYVFRILRGAFAPPTPTPTATTRPPLGSEVISFLLASISLLLGTAPSWALALLMQTDEGR